MDISYGGPRHGNAAHVIARHGPGRDHDTRRDIKRRRSRSFCRRGRNQITRRSSGRVRRTLRKIIRSTGLEPIPVLRIRCQVRMRVGKGRLRNLYLICLRCWPCRRRSGRPLNLMSSAESLSFPRYRNLRGTYRRCSQITRGVTCTGLTAPAIRDNDNREQRQYSVDKATKHRRKLPKSVHCPFL